MKAADFADPPNGEESAFGIQRFTGLIRVGNITLLFHSPHHFSLDFSSVQFKMLVTRPGWPISASPCLRVVCPVLYVLTLFQCWCDTPEGRPGMSDVSPLSGISELLLDSILVSPLLLFCLLPLLFLSCLFSAYWPILLMLFNIFFS